VLKSARSKTEESSSVFNVTSKSATLKELSPFYPHGGFKVPFTPHASESVEGIWQGLKVFKRDVDAPVPYDVKSFENKSMKNLKRTIAKNGEIAGHYQGPNQPLLGIADARKLIYIPAYAEQLKRCQTQLDMINAQWEKGPITLLDYDLNEDFRADKPLSHASLIKRWLLRGNLDNPDSWISDAPKKRPHIQSKREELQGRIDEKVHALGQMTDVSTIGQDVEELAAMCEELIETFGPRKKKKADEDVDDDVNLERLKEKLATATEPVFG
jgi:hypothetical protein